MKKDEWKAKNDTDTNPPGGMGNGIERAYSELFLLPAVTILANWYDASWFLYRMKPRAYKVQKLKISVKKETLGGIQKAQKSLSNRISSYFLLYLLKTSNIMRLKYSQEHSKLPLGQLTFNQKKLS